MKQQDAIIDQAKSEASAIMEQADRETVSEKQRIKADVRKEMCGLALAMTGRFADHADPQRGEALLAVSYTHLSESPSKGPGNEIQALCTER